MRILADARVYMGTFIDMCMSLSIVKVKAVTDPIYSVFTVHNDSALQHVYLVSPAVLDIGLWKDVDEKVARLILTVENTAYEESLEDLVPCCV